MQTLMERYGFSDSWCEVKPHSGLAVWRVGRDLVAKYIARDVCAGNQPDKRLLDAFVAYEKAIKEATNRAE